MLLPDLTARLERDAPGVALRHTDANSAITNDDSRESWLDLMILLVQALRDSVPLFRGRFLFATDLVGMIPRQLAERAAGPAGLKIYPLPFVWPRAELSPGV